MLTYLFRRVNLFISTSLVIFIVIFTITNHFPVDQRFALTGIHSPTGEQIVDIDNRYQLHSDTATQFISYFQQRITGELGLSATSQQPVLEELISVVPATLELSIIAILLALSAGIPLGILASLSKNKLVQNLIMTLTLTGYSIPVFWLGLTLSLWFGVQLGWFPISGQINLLYEIEPITHFVLIDTLLNDSPYSMSAFLDATMHIILPAITLAVLPFTVIVRITRSSMLTIMEQNFIKAAEARGLHTLTIVRRHALPNTLIPIVKNLGLMLGTFASYILIVEMIFSWPGVGSWLVAGIYQRDYTVIQAGALSVSITIVLISILIEILYSLINPVFRKELYGTN